MPDGNDEVTMSQIRALDRRISDHKLEVNQSLSDSLMPFVKSIGELTTEIKLSNKNQSHTDEKLSVMASKLDENSKAIAVLDKGLSVISTTQGNMLGVTGKVFPYMMALIGSAVVALMSVSLYLKVNPLV